MIAIRRVSIIPTSTRMSLWSRRRVHVLILLVVGRRLVSEGAKGHVVQCYEGYDRYQAEYLRYC